MVEIKDYFFQGISEEIFTSALIPGQAHTRFSLVTYGVFGQVSKQKF